MSNEKRDVAVFIDFENVYVSVREKLDETPNFESIMDRCNDLGRVVIARAYADWYRFPRITSALYANGIEPMYVPTYYYDKEMGRTGRAIKNSVDMNMCIDAMKTLFLNNNIASFVLVTGDRDFIPLVNSIRQQGKEVLIIGIGGAASTHLAQSADEFIFYEQLVGKKPVTTTQKAKSVRTTSEVSSRGSATTRASNNNAASDTATPEPDIYDTLVAAVHVVRERGYLSTLGSLKLVVKELMGGDFKESRYKDMNGRSFTKFKDFVLDAEKRGKVQIYTNGTVSEVFLPGEDARKLSQFADLHDDTNQENQEQKNGSKEQSSSSSSSSSRSRRRRRPRNRQDTSTTSTPATSSTSETAAETAPSDASAPAQPQADQTPPSTDVSEQPSSAPAPAPETVDAQPAASTTAPAQGGETESGASGADTATSTEHTFPALGSDVPFLFNLGEALTLSGKQETTPIPAAEAAEEAATPGGEAAATPADAPATHTAERDQTTTTAATEGATASSESTDSTDSTEEPEEKTFLFTDEEWDAFRLMMSRYTRPVSFGQIFDALRSLRKQKVLTRTNEQLRSFVKQAITEGVLERSGRGKRVYYKLHQDHHVEQEQQEQQEQQGETDNQDTPETSDTSSEGDTAETTDEGQQDTQDMTDEGQRDT